MSYGIHGKSTHVVGPVPCLVILLAWTVAAVCSQATPADGPSPQTTEQAYKNIQVLKGVPSEQLMPAMEFIRASLGVECDYCHDQSAFERDDKDHKQTARRMMRMVFAINKDTFDGQRQVTCYSCHRGSVKPVEVPVIGGEKTRPALDEGSTAREMGQSLPDVEHVLARYVAALGGGEALRSISSRVEQGTVTVAGRQYRFAAIAKAPDKRISTTYLPNGESITAYDGRSGWLAAPGRPVHVMKGSELDAAKVDADFVPATHLKQTFSDLRVARLAEVAGRKAYVMMALEAGRFALQAWFDAQSGLLLRLVRYEESPLGRNPIQVDFGDYRSIDGVKHAFRRTVTRARGGFTMQIEKVQHNVTVDDGRFARPEAVPDGPR